MPPAVLRQVSSRNSSRSKGLRAKKFIQAALLVVVTVWLLYQLNHPDSNPPGDEDDARAQAVAQEEKTAFGGRRGLIPGRKEELSIGDRIQDEEIREIEQEMKHGGADAEFDAIDEQDQGDEVANAEEHLQETGEKSSGGDEVKREHLQQAREKSFHGDNVASAVIHNASSGKDQDEASRLAEDESDREAWERDFGSGEDASSSAANGDEEKAESSPSELQLSNVTSLNATMPSTPPLEEMGNQTNVSSNQSEPFSGAKQLDQQATSMVISVSGTAETTSVSINQDPLVQSTDPAKSIRFENAEQHQDSNSGGDASLRTVDGGSELDSLNRRPAALSMRDKDSANALVFAD